MNCKEKNMNWVFFGPSVRAVYEVIKESVGEDGLCLLSTAELAEKSGWSSRAVNNALAILKKEGMIFTTRKGGSRKISLKPFEELSK